MTYGDNFTDEAAGVGGGHTGEIIRTEMINPPFAEELRASAATPTSTFSYNITLALDFPMNVEVVLSASVGAYVGPYVLLGPNPAGGTHTENLTAVANGGVTLASRKVYGPTGTLTFSGPAQNNALGTFTVNTGRRCGLVTYTAKEFAANGNKGVVMVVLAGSEGEEYDFQGPTKGALYGPTETGGKGAYEAAIGNEFAGLALTLTFLATD